MMYCLTLSPWLKGLGMASPWLQLWPLQVQCPAWPRLPPGPPALAMVWSTVCDVYRLEAVMGATWRVVQANERGRRQARGQLEENQSFPPFWRKDDLFHHSSWSKCSTLLKRIEEMGYKTKHWNFQKNLSLEENLPWSRGLSMPLTMHSRSRFLYQCPISHTVK